MAWLVPDVGEVELLKRVLYSDADAENFTLKLYKTSVTPAESDTASAYTVADFTNYANVTLTSSQSGSTWAVPTTSGGVTSSTYGTNASWTSGSTQTVYGQYIIGASSSILLFAEAFSSGLALVSGSSLTITPRIALD